MSVRGKVAVELVTIAVLTTIFLLAFPKRSPVVDVGLAGFALLCLALSTWYIGNRWDNDDNREKEIARSLPSNGFQLLPCGHRLLLLTGITPTTPNRWVLAELLVKLRFIANLVFSAPFA